MSELNSKLLRDDPATYYTELGAQAESERIIKLIESVATEVNRAMVFDSNKRDDPHRKMIAAVCYHLVKLIKGEQK